MIVSIFEDEDYPVYALADKLGTGQYDIDVPQEVVDRWKKSQESYNESQNEMSEYFRAANKAWRIKSGYQKE